MEPGREEQLARLQRLARERISRGLAAGVLSTGREPSARAASPDSAEFSEHMLCRPAAGGSWCFWWPWKQPIGSAEDLTSAAARIMTVLRSVGGTS